MLPTEPNTPSNSRVWSVVHFPLVLLAIAFAMMTLGGLALTAIMRVVDGGHATGVDLPGRMLGTAIIVLVYWLFVRFVERRRTIVEFGRNAWWRELAAGWLGGFALFSAVVAVIALLGGYRVIGTNPASVVLVPLVVTACTGVTEEIILRGIFFRLLERLCGSWIALVLSAALFGAAHLGNPNATPFAGFAIALEAGVMLAALYMVTRRLWAAIGLHAAWNLAQGAVYGIAVSGFEQRGLLRPLIAGPELLTGGSFGAEASLPALVIDTAFGIALLALAVRRGRVVAPMWSRRGQRAAVQA